MRSVPQPRAIVVFDIGKSSLKLIVCSAETGRLEHHVWTPNAVVDEPPYPHFDVDRIWDWLMAQLTEAARKFDIHSIIPVTHGATAALMEGSQLALPVLDYEHTAPFDEDVETYRAIRPPFSETFSPFLPCGLNLGRQLWWQATRFPEKFARAGRILFYPQYWTWRLSGVSASEVTSAGCHTDLWNPLEETLSSLVKQRGWESLFPPFHRAGEPMGPVHPEIAQHTGLSPQTQVLNGIHDSNASYFRHLAYYGERPFSVLSTGTWIIAMGGHRPLQKLDETRDCLANVDAYGTPVPCARFMGGREFEGIVGEARAAAHADCDAVVRALIDRETFALPSFEPTSGPFAGRTGSIEGQPPRSDVEAAGLGALYLALMSDVCLELIGSEGDIHVEGKLGGNATFLHLLAALRPKQSVFVTEDATGTAYGAVLLAAGITPRAPANPAPRGRFPGLQRYAEKWRALASHVRS
jgi:sugar (pentulose or hexulose) kinase